MSQPDSAQELTQPCNPSAGDLDYLGLDSETRELVQCCTSEIKALAKRTSVDTIKIGENILAVKAQLKHGQFGKWLETEFQWSRRTAYNYITAFESFGNCANFAQLDFATSALYSLAKSSTPEAARQEALKRAAQGERITSSKARKIIDDHINPPIVPEVLLPHQRVASAQKQARPSLVIKVEPSTVAPKNPESQESVAETMDIEDGTLPCLPLASEKILEFRPSLKELKPESIKNAYSERKTGSRFERSPASSPLIQDLRGELDGAILKHNPLQSFKLSAEGVSLRFEARAGDLVSWLQQSSFARGSAG
jgi:hypothetical protein